MSPSFVRRTLCALLSVLYACDSRSASPGPLAGEPPPLSDRGVRDATPVSDMQTTDAQAPVDIGLTEDATLTPSECSNELDDDGDGLTDYPSDPGCASPSDSDERDDGVGPSTAQCGNELDDDEDGYVDLADSDCSDLNDLRERPLEAEVAPACSDGIDNDLDGLIDAFEDPGCAYFGDQDELDPEEPPACGNHVDDDRDGLIDYPHDPGCISIGDLSELDPTRPTACRDGLDNDGDGAVDFPADPGCESASSSSERPVCLGEARLIEAQEGVRYQVASAQGRHRREASCGGRGSPDLTLFYRLDRGLRSLKIHSEGSWETTLSAWPRCAEGRELACVREPVGDGGRNVLIIEDPRPGPYYVSVDGASALGGEATVWVEEDPIEACQDGVDNDLDGYIDAPFDPGCLSPTDEDESTPSPAPHCGDGLDNDADGQLDYPQDRGCYQASDPSEEDECGLGVRVLPLDDRYPVTRVDTSSTPEQTSELSGSCGQSQGFEAVYVINNPSHARLSFSLTRTDGLEDYASMYLRAGDCLSGAELGCSSGLLLPHMRGEELPPASSLHLEVESAPQGALFLVIDHPLDGLPYELKVNRTPLPPRCRDDRDNDGDGLIDSDDPGCEGPEDESELDPGQTSECHDLIDNDGDGLYDHPYDPGCLYRGGLSELDPQQTPSCSNGLDDNGDGYADFPYDPGCSSHADETEAEDATEPACWNRLDDDGDGAIDFPEDEGCTGRGDRSEQAEQWRPQCSDGLDNDGDGALDFPYDQACAGRGTRSERSHTDESPVCSNGEDDDQDGATDFPFDPGCLSRADDSEEDPDLIPLCANGYDDDGNGRVDWPDDPGCSYSADSREEGTPDPNPRCSDGVDNDLDGMTDLEDEGCEGPADDDEQRLDLAVPACADGLDNDQDGLIDWPQDFGCAGAGDQCEQGGQLSCEIDGERRCVAVLSNEERCGACDVSCEPGARCVQGYCEGAYSLKRELLRCTYTGRDLNDFLVGPLDPSNTGGALSIRTSCTPDEDTQALLIPRSSSAALNRAQAEVKRYVERGGTLITERGRSQQVYRLITGLEVALPVEEYGACEGNPMPVIQRNPEHPIWSLAPYASPLSTETGCGVDLSLLPGVVDLGGWSQLTSSLSYLDYGRGRVWFVEADWGSRPSGESATTEAGLALMAAMIHGVAPPRHPLTPECDDGVDNDLDAVADLWDMDCQGRDDMSESAISPQPLTWVDEGYLDSERLAELRASGVECLDGLDNDMNGQVDFPYDAGCEAMGDRSEAPLPAPVACDDGLDNDGDGATDWPQDVGCAGRGDRSERSALSSAPCANGRDEDRDGLLDWPDDLDCVSPQSSGELKSAPLRAARSPSLLLSLHVAGAAGLKPCGNGIDDDADEMIDLDDLDCLTSFDESEGSPLEVSDPTEAEGVGCADGLDNDQDGQIDWPDDLACLGPFSLSEDSGCETDITLSPAQLWEGSFGPSAHPVEGPESACTRGGGGVILAKYTHAGGDLTLSLRDREGELPVALSVRRSCVGGAEVACLSSSELQERAGRLQLPDARPGTYWVTAHQLPPPEFNGEHRTAELPEDPRSFVATHDLSNQCWLDGGRNAFNCMGLLNVHLEELTIPLNISEGSHVIDLDGQPFHYQSSFVHQNIWRLRWSPPPSAQLNERFVSAYLTLRGNLGSAEQSLSIQGVASVDEAQLRYLYMTDSLTEPNTPPSLLWLVPSDPSQAEAITYHEEEGAVAATSPISRPLTIYIVASYLPREALISSLTQLIESPDRRPREGSFGLTASSGGTP